MTLSATVNCSATPYTQGWQAVCSDGKNATSSGNPAAISVGPGGAINTAELTEAITCTATITVVDTLRRNATGDHLVYRAVSGGAFWRARCLSQLRHAMLRWPCVGGGPQHPTHGC